MRQPLDKGRICYVAEKYQTERGEKNRYAVLGRATKWPGDRGGEDLQLELDSLPVGHYGPLKLYVFWDSESQQQSAQQATNQGYQQPQPANQNYQQAQANYANQRGNR